ncbi:MAG: PTS transporter subunit IIC [Alkalispirochaeta sp.]
MQYLSTAIDTFFSFPAYVMLPLIIFVMALAVRMRLGDAFFIGLRLGVGFAGVFIAFDFFVSNISPAVEALSAVRGLDFPVLDVGWPPLAAITFGTLIGPLAIPFIVVLNIAMLALGWTRTVYIDLWNIWHFALVGALIQIVTGSLWLGIAVTVVIAVYGFLNADLSATYVKREVRLPSVAISPLSAIGVIPFGAMMDRIYDRIPGIRKLEFNPEKQGTSVGLIGEPMVLGLLVGLVLAIAAGYSLRDTLELGVHIAAVMFLLPRAAGLIGEGFAPMGEHLKEVLARRFGADHELHFAMDVGVIMSHKSVMAGGLIMIPITLILAFLVPGNRILPIGDLPGLIAAMSVLVLLHRGNVVRAVLTGIPLVAAYLAFSSALAPLYTRLSANAGVTFETTREISAFIDGGNPVRFWLFYLFQGNIWAIVAIPAVLGMLWIARRHAAAG